MEAKRAVPRSEVSRDSSVVKPNGSTGNSPSLRPMGTLGWSTGSLISSPSLNSMNMNLTQSQIMSESRQASDPRISMDEYAYNKIFVGGLHYDTRDGE